MKLKATSALALALSALAAPAQAQFSLSTGLEYLTGDYGKARSTDEWRIPLALSYRTGPWNFRLSLPLSRVEGVASVTETEARASGDGDFIGDDPDEDNDGVANLDDDDDDNDGVADDADGDDDNDGVDDISDDDDDADGVPDNLESTNGSTAGGAGGGGGGGGASASSSLRDRRQSGIGDATLSAFYTLLDSQSAAVGLELGARVKIPVASGRKCYLTNGEIDYSVQANIYQTFGRWEPYASIGWTKRGDPQARNADCEPIPGVNIDLRNPFYATLGVGTRISDAMSLRLEYEHRGKLRRTSDPKSEARVALQYRVSDAWRVGGYALAGFSDNSPDWGLGITASYRF